MHFKIFQSAMECISVGTSRAGNSILLEQLVGTFLALLQTWLPNSPSQMDVASDGPLGRHDAIPFTWRSSPSSSRAMARPITRPGQQEQFSEMGRRGGNIKKAAICGMLEGKLQFSGQLAEAGVWENISQPPPEASSSAPATDYR